MIDNLLQSPLEFSRFQKWLGTDSIENSQPWNKEITYILTHNGYRFNPDDLESKHSIMFGCSHVFGLGNAIEDTIPDIISEYLGHPVINLGQRASSNLFQCINAQRIIESGVRPENVFVLWPDSCRTTYFWNNSVEMCGMWQTVQTKMSPYYKEYLKSESHVNIMDRYLKFSFNSLWNVPVYSLNINDIEVVDTARDNFHWGPKTNKLVADKFIQLLDLQI